MTKSGQYDGLPVPNSGIAKWGSRIGQVVDIILHPCQPTVEVWTLAWFQALPTLLLSPIKPTPTDYLIKRFGGPHGGERRWSWDLAENAGLPQVDTPGLQWVVHLLEQDLVKGLWYGALADALTGYLLNWVSAVYAMQQCKFPGEPYCQLTNGPVGYGPNQKDVRMIWSVNSEHIMSGGGYYVTMPPDLQPSIGLAVSSIPDPLYPNTPGSISNVRVVASDFNQVAMTVPLTTNPKTGVTSGANKMFKVPTYGSGSYEVLFDADNGNCVVQPGYWSLFAQPSRDNIRPDP